MGKSNFETAIEKCEKAIKLHSIKARPKSNVNKRKTAKEKAYMARKEFNPFLRHAWLLMGKAQFQQGNFIEAASTFNYISGLYAGQPEIVSVARAYLARCYVELEWPYDAEDVFQETFLAYYRAKKSFRSEEHRRAWLIRTACNHCKKITGSTWRKRTISLEEVPEQSFTFSLPEENELFAAFHTLSLQYRTVLYLHDFAGYTSEEIGKMLKMRPGTIRMQLTRGRAILRKQLKGDEPDAFG